MTGGKRAKDLGKRAELRATKDLGGARSKLHGVSAPDILDAKGNRVEVKFRSSLPKWLDDIFFGTRTSVDYAVVYVKGRRDGLVVQRLSRFKEVEQVYNLPDMQNIHFEED